MKKTLRHCLHDCSAIAMIEFALALPLMCLLLVGAIEITSFAIAHQKMDKVAFAMSDMVTQQKTISEEQLADFTQAAQKIMRPFSFDGTVIFSSVLGYPPSATLPKNCPHPADAAAVPICVKWQSGGVTDYTSKIGNEDGTATLPGGYTLSASQDVIVVEVYYIYRPLLGGLSREVLSGISGGNANEIGDNGLLLYKSALYKPRQGTLTTLIKRPKL